MSVDTNGFTIERPADPTEFYEGHAAELAVVGADAFSQPAEVFARQVSERFDKAEIAQIIRYGRHIVGFALYELMRGRHWRRYLVVD